MNDLMRRAWWMLAIRGVAALLFGILAMAWPAITLLVLVALFAAYAFVTAAVYIAGALKNRNEKGWGLVLVLGLVAVAAGGVAVFHPLVTALVLVLLMGANALVSGILDIAMAVRLRKEIRNEWLLVLSGIVSIVFGALVMVFPGAGALALVWLVSFYSVLTGVLLLSLALRLRKSGRPASPGGPSDSRDRLVGA